MARFLLICVTDKLFPYVFIHFYQKLHIKVGEILRTDEIQAWVNDINAVLILLKNLKPMYQNTRNRF